MRAVVAQPKWPTIRWVVGELKYYVWAGIIAGVAAIGVGLVLSIVHDGHEAPAPLPAPVDGSKIDRPQPTPAVTTVEPMQPTPAVATAPGVADISRAWDDARASDDVALLAKFAVTYPDNEFAHIAWQRIDVLLKSGHLQVASLDNNVDLIALVLEHKNDAESFLEPLIKERDLPNKYPFGYAIFYADGRKLFNYGPQKNTLITVFNPNINNDVKVMVTFDPSLLQLKFHDNRSVCLSDLPVRINGKPPIFLKNVCLGAEPGSTIGLFKESALHVALDLEPLGTSQQGLAWVVGLKSTLSRGPRAGPSP